MLLAVLVLGPLRAIVSGSAFLVLVGPLVVRLFFVIVVVVGFGEVGCRVPMLAVFLTRCSTRRIDWIVVPYHGAVADLSAALKRSQQRVQHCPCVGCSMVPQACMFLCHNAIRSRRGSREGQVGSRDVVASRELEDEIGEVRRRVGAGYGRATSGRWF